MGVLDFLPIVGDVANSLSQSRQNRLNREFAASQADLAWNRSLEQWERETQYNSFSNQMKLLADAGLNPNLAYDQSTDSASGQTPQMAQYAGVAPQFNSPLQVKQMQLLDAQISNLNSQSHKTDKETQILGVQFTDLYNTLLAKQNVADEYRSSYWSHKISAEISRFEADVKQAELESYDAFTLLMYVQNFGTSVSVENLKKLQKDIELSDEQIATLKGNLVRIQYVNELLTTLDNDISLLPKQLQGLARLLIHVFAGTPK